MSDKKKYKFDKYSFYSKYIGILTVIMVISFVATFIFFLSFTPPNPSTYVEGKTPVLPYIAAKANPNIYRRLTLISFSTGLISLILMVLPMLKTIIFSKKNDNFISSKKVSSEEKILIFNDPHEIKRFTEFIYYQLVSQNKKLASELRQFSGNYFTTSSEYLGELRKTLNKIIMQENISLDDDTSNKILYLIHSINKALDNKI